MEKTNNLLSVEENAIVREEIKNAPMIQQIARYIWWVVLLFSFYLFFHLHFWWGFLAFFGSIIIYGVGELPANKAKEIIKKEKDEKLNEILSSKGLTCSQKYSTENYELTLVVDELQNKLCIIDYELREFLFSDVLEVEVVMDEVQITKTSRSSQIGGAVIGGALAGGVGAAIGGLSGDKTTSSDKTSKIYLKMIVNDTHRPYITVDFLNEKNPILKKDKKVIEATNDVNHWYGLISVLIKRAG